MRWRFRTLITPFGQMPYRVGKVLRGVLLIQSPKAFKDVVGDFARLSKRKVIADLFFLRAMWRVVIVGQGDPPKSCEGTGLPCNAHASASLADRPTSSRVCATITSRVLRLPLFQLAYRFIQFVIWTFVPEQPQSV
jgi:hypothetical protein